MTNVPHEQVMKSLALANATRYAQSALKQSVAWDEIDIKTVISDPPPYINKLLLFDVLQWKSGIGRHKTLALLHKVRISESRMIGNLTKRERELLVSYL